MCSYQLLRCNRATRYIINKPLTCPDVIEFLPDLWRESHHSTVHSSLEVHEWSPLCFPLYVLNESYDSRPRLGFLYTTTAMKIQSNKAWLLFPWLRKSNNDKLKRFHTSVISEDGRALCQNIYAFAGITISGSCYALLFQPRAQVMRGATTHDILGHSVRVLWLKGSD